MMSVEDARRSVVVDTSVLINLAITSNLDLLDRFAGFRFVVVPEALAEIIDEIQKRLVETAINDGQLEVVTVEGADALEVFAGLRATVGAADAACVAFAVANNCVVAADDRHIRREVEKRCGPNRVITTPGLLLLAIRQGLITIDDADKAKAVLAENRFVMSLDSFRGKVEP